MDNVELSRRIENLLRIGIVAEVDVDNALVRVDSGGLKTQWLPWFERRAGKTRTWDPPTVGEQVLILSPSGELAAGIVLVGIYSAAHDAPDDSHDTHVIDYPDGARISYNHASGHLEAVGIKTGRIEAAVSITLDTPDTFITGTLTVDDLLTYKNGLRGFGGASNGNIVSGNFIHGEDGVLSSYGVVLHTHTHPGDSGGTTGEPN